MNALTLQQDGEGWRLCLNGDWSLASIGQIYRELEALPGSMLGTLICDWSRAGQPGIGAVWLLLTRLSALGAGESPTAKLSVRHEGGPPPAIGVAIGELGHWAVQEGVEARGVLGFFGRITAVFGEIFSRPRALRLPSI